MSGSTIGGFVGGAIGFYFGGPTGAQWGFMIGSGVGGYVDPQKIEGPRLTDAQTQTSNEGVPRPIVYGTAAVAGNITQRGPLVEHKTAARSGKGGPEVTTYTYTRTIAIRICEAAPLGGTMKLRRAWMDDKLVYDASGTGVIDGDSAKFKSILKFYSGDETQLPDPSLEALPAANGGGVGNVPSYRGTCYAVLTDLDCTDRQGAVPQFRWEVCSVASEAPMIDPGIEAGRLAKFVNAHDPRGDSADSYTYSGRWTDGFGGGHSSPTYNTIDEVLNWANSAAGGIKPQYYIGYRASSASDIGIYTTSTGSFDVTVAQPDVSDLTSVLMFYQWHLPNDGLSFQNVPFSEATATGTPWHGDRAGYIYTRSNPGEDLLWNPVWLNNVGYTGYALYPLCIEVKPKLIIDSVPEGSIPIPDVADYWLTPDGRIVPTATYTKVAGTFKVLTDGWSSGSDPNNKYVTHWQGPAVQSGNQNYSNSSFWIAAYNAAVAAGTMPAGMTYNSSGTGSVTTTYPQVVSTAFSRGPSSNNKVIPGSIPLSQIAVDLCDRADVPASQIDASALAGISVRGFPIARQTSTDAALRELMQVFFFDLPEWGNSGDDTTKLRAVLRGGAVAVTVADDDLVESDDDEETRAQQVEFPRKVTLTFADPDANYEPASQPAERTTENIKAVGESQISTSVVLSRTEAAVVVDRLLKTLWEEANGRINRELPEEFTRFTTSDIVSYLGKRWRLEKTELQDGSVRWDMVRDRASNATSTAAGSPAPTPTPAASSTRGPTMFSAMNLPRLRSQDTTPGMYVAVCGRLAGWIGCDLYLSVDDGVTEQLVATITAPATMGTLSAALAAAGATASVSLWKGELASVTVDQLLARQNAAAITTANVSEILQFQTATDTGTDAYDLTSLSRGVLGTTAADHVAADSFVLLDAAVVFVPLDIGLAGKTLIFRPVSIGTAPANNATYSVPFQPKFTGPQVVEAYTDDAGNVYTDDAGNNYYYEVPSP